MYLLGIQLCQPNSFAITDQKKIKKVLAKAIFLVYNIKCCDIDSVEA
jgi:hypothetical protein